MPTNTSETWVAVLDIAGLTTDEYDAIVTKMGVESAPAAGIFLHIAAPISGGGLRVIELWETKEGFESFIQARMIPAATALGLERETTVSLTPLHNVFGPRILEVPDLPRTRTAS